ncbi:acyltransferase family protein [Rhizobium sp. S96]|uniref:acyltransferase family protein n=1 Tax=Rhizobium sp. S96 TaxID=3055140 RepID=UPI0025AACE50|nr:acyltransferase family protein [Rhizobium sp. S96]MDM9622242.1 acyltransferase family protein [Rhizobium sp. S96]
MIKNRNDIDGLRAFAVGFVVLYHCGFSKYVPGGFVGVDMFFVISGFLITGIVYSAIERGEFSIVEFYNRRVRRIFPALVPVYLAVMAWAFITKMPSGAHEVASNVISSLLFISNWFFYTKAGYFDDAAASNYVLHTWSLSVEEQFYIFLPLALLMLSRVRRMCIVGLLAAISVASLAAAQWMVSVDQSAAFYLLQYRAWELLAGALLAIGRFQRPSDTRIANALALFATALIAASAFGLSEAIPFPGLAALPVCIGTLLLVYTGAGGGTVVSRMLGAPAIRFVGLVSYSFYLWHWPVWLAGSELFDPNGVLEKLMLIAISFVLAVLSWRYVESPFRRTPYGISSLRAVSYGVICLSAMSVAAVSLPLLSQAVWQVPPSVETLDGFRYSGNATDYRSGTCFLSSASDNPEKFQSDKCLAISDVKPDYLLIGDSHAAHLYAGLVATRSINVLQASASGCKPVIGSTGAERCTKLMSFVMNDFLPKHRVDTIMLSARWKQSDLPGLLQTVEWLKHYSDRILVFGPIVEYEEPLPKVLAKSLYYGDPDLVAEYRVDDQQDTDRIMSAELGRAGVEYISVYKALCPDKNCTVWDAAHLPIQFDYGHLTGAGSRLLINRVETALLEPRKTMRGTRDGNR